MANILCILSKYFTFPPDLTYADYVKSCSIKIKQNQATTTTPINKI